MFKNFATILLLATAILGSPGVHAQKVGDRAKLNHLTTFDGNRIDPQIVEGKPTLLYFWASWCPICRKEMPVIEKHFQAYKDKGFNVLAVNFRDTEGKARAMLNAVGPISFPVGMIDDAWVKDYPDLKGTPTWYLLDRKGTIRKVIVGQEVISGGFFDGLAGELKKVASE